ncbi:MAG: hypothetical protein Q8R10_16950 [Pseudomonas sp.]|uniref:hypothetical protein n=1 Tax=Pseudomonas sp. TaxID=306 RepID=UPI002733F35C|nr:hypothetical protein [Pseudomonas sp.]MDP3848105.1 hypothetical protein [Pseudomonas sp.]
MSAVLLAFRSPLTLARREPALVTVEYVSATEDSKKLLLIDRALGTALGYADPLAAMDALYSAHEEEFVGHSGMIQPHQPEPSGRDVVRVFDLEGAMRMCRLALTPLSGVVFGNIKGTETGCAVRAFESASMLSAQILPFPLGGKPGREEPQ